MHSEARTSMSMNGGYDCSGFMDEPMMSSPAYHGDMHTSLDECSV